MCRAVAQGPDLGTAVHGAVGAGASRHTSGAHACSVWTYFLDPVERHAAGDKKLPR